MSKAIQRYGAHRAPQPCQKQFVGRAHTVRRNHAKKTFNPMFDGDITAD
jgi:hypothetical protein